MPEPTHSILRKQKQAQVQNLLREYAPLLMETIEELKRELNVEITGSTADEIALEYKRRQGGREALHNFLQRLNAKGNDH